MESESLGIEKVGGKWEVVGYRKWKAKIAVEVCKSGGKWKEYCKRINQVPNHRSQPSHAIEAMQKANVEITKLSPTWDEITAYGEYLSVTEHITMGL